MSDILNSTDFTLSLLEEFIAQCIYLTLARKNSPLDFMAPSITVPVQFEALLVISVECLSKHIEKWVEITEEEGVCPDIPYLARSLVLVLISYPHLPVSIQLTNEIPAFALKFFNFMCCSLPLYDSVAMETAIDLCSVVRHIISVGVFMFHYVN